MNNQEKKALGNNVTDPCNLCLLRIGCKNIECHDSDDKPNFVSDLESIICEGRR